MSIEKWRNATPPNYETNKDKLYPYSELPDLSEYKVIKIPHCVKDLIEHVDYFGLGRIETNRGYLGFPDCYNVNFEFTLVPSGKDQGRKLPNRIPIPSNTKSNSDYYTSNYIKDNSVLTVTYTPYCEHIMSDSIAKDIARIVNGYSGKVIVYGYNINDTWECNQILTISEELKKMKQLFYCPIYMLPEKLQLTHYKTSYRVYLSLSELKKNLYNNIVKAEAEAAIILTGCLTDVYCFNALSEVVNKLLENKVVNVIKYAYQLWSNNAKDIVCNYFPTVFKLMFSSDCITIVNKKYNEALTIENSTEMLVCSTHDKTTSDVKWKIIPILQNEAIVFYIKNVDSDSYLNINTDEYNGRKTVHCLKDIKEDEEEEEEISQKFYFDPLMINGQIAFNIVNYYHDHHLKMGTSAKASEIKTVVRLEDNSTVRDESCEWIFTPWIENEKNDVNDDT